VQQTLNVSFYQFFDIPDPDFVQAHLAKAVLAFTSMRGTVLIAPEGINACCAGQHTDITGFLQSIRAFLPQLSVTPIKESWSEENPFRKMIVKTRREAIAFGESGIDPATDTGARLDPLTFKQWMDNPQRPFLLVDTRNDYEVDLGTFEGAIDPRIRTFKEFPDWVRKNLGDKKDTPIVTFCTGGIRCEKATALMKQEGFREVYQIDGGILNYLEATQSSPKNHWNGNCFVFDHRVAVDRNLAPTQHRICYACWHVLEPEDTRDSRFKQGSHCPYCFEEQSAKRQRQLELIAQRRQERLEVSIQKGLEARRAHELKKASQANPG
jgi:predicted sulfurtransferase